MLSCLRRLEDLHIGGYPWVGGTTDRMGNHIARAFDSMAHLRALVRPFWTLLA